jgi:hypothetical protein
MFVLRPVRADVKESRPPITPPSPERPARRRFLAGFLIASIGTGLASGSTVAPRAKAGSTPGNSAAVAVTRAQPAITMRDGHRAPAMTPGQRVATMAHSQRAPIDVRIARSRRRRSARGFLLGSKTIGSKLEISPSRLADAFLFTAAADGIVSAITVYVDSHNKATRLVVGLYSNRVRQPGSRLTSGVLKSPKPGGWDRVAVSRFRVKAGTRYWVAVLGDGGPLYLRDVTGARCHARGSQKSGLRFLPLSWTGADASKYCRISVYVSGTRKHPHSAPTNISPPAIRGTTQQGETLNTTNGSWTGNPTNYAYQWQLCTSSGCANVSGATSSRYMLKSSDVGDTIDVVVTATNSVGSGSATSAKTGAVTVPAPPSNTAVPVISGTAQQGQTLTTSNGSWTNSPTSYAYQWQDCTTTGCTNIAGATSSSYTLQSSDVGDTIDAIVTATNAGGSASQASAQTSAVTNGGGSAPVNTAEPVISGTVATGDTLSTTNGSWSGSPTSYSYRWQDCATDGTSCSNISDATSSTYTVTSGDTGHTIEAEVTATNANGSTATGAPTVPLIDDFGGSSVDTNVWAVLNQQGDTSNNETECYITGQTAESSSTLTETAIVNIRPAPPTSGHCPSGTPNSTATSWDSGAVQEKATAFTYGTVVVKASLPGTGVWPAIWLLGAACQSPNWLTANGSSGGFNCPWDSDSSDAAEIDIAEGLNGTLNEQLHSNGSNSPDCRPSITITGTHTYELDWSAGSLTWKVDGTTECSTTTNVPSHPMFLIIDTAICSSASGCGGGPTNGDFPATTTVDYVHVSH